MLKPGLQLPKPVEKGCDIQSFVGTKFDFKHSVETAVVAPEPVEKHSSLEHPVGIDLEASDAAEYGIERPSQHLAADTTNEWTVYTNSKQRRLKARVQTEAKKPLEERAVVTAIGNTYSDLPEMDCP